MKRIKIVTYCTWTSIGSILQAFALKKALSEIGYESVILLDGKDNAFGKIKIHSLKSFIKRLFEIINNKSKKLSYKKRLGFVNKNIDTEVFYNYEVLEKEGYCDSTVVYLAGSDQIWNPMQCNPLFFLEFAKNNRCISYAASMGKTQIPDDKASIIKAYLEKFDYISVREYVCAEVLSDLTDKDIEVNIDPTFLLSAEEWRKYEKEYKVKGPYILLYMLYWNDGCRNKIKSLKKKTGLPVYAISNGLSGVYADKVLYDVGIEEFLWLMDNAKYVVTSSFHGAAFSVIFNKKFATLINPEAPSRIVNLLETLMVPMIEIDFLNDADDYDYKTINARVVQEKNKSILYLKKAIEENR